MRITPSLPATFGSRRAVRARIEWEDVDRPSLETYVAVQEQHADLLAETLEWSLIGALPAAVRDGERRIAIAGSVDPVLLEGLQVVQRYHQLWYGLAPVIIETEGVRDANPPVGGLTSGLLMSGGVDSLASLATNRLQYPRNHRGFVTHCLYVDLVGPRDTEGLSSHDRSSRWAALERVVEADGAELVAIVTNVRALGEYEFQTDWMLHAHGLVFGSVAHALSRRFWRVLIASSYDAGHLSNWGSHPLTDGHLATSHCRLWHHNESLTRMDKVRMLAARPMQLQALDVCFEWARPNATALNCGKCEKCQRTLLALRLNGLTTTTFESSEVSTKTIGGLPPLQDDYERAAWLEIQELVDDPSLHAAVGRLIVRHQTPMRGKIRGLAHRMRQGGR